MNGPRQQRRLARRDRRLPTRLREQRGYILPTKLTELPPASCSEKTHHRHADDARQRVRWIKHEEVRSRAHQGRQQQSRRHQHLQAGVSSSEHQCESSTGPQPKRKHEREQPEGPYHSLGPRHDSVSRQRWRDCVEREKCNYSTDCGLRTHGLKCSRWSGKRMVLCCERSNQCGHGAAATIDLRVRRRQWLVSRRYLVQRLEAQRQSSGPRAAASRSD